MPQGGDGGGDGEEGGGPAGVVEVPAAAEVEEVLEAEVAGEEGLWRTGVRG